MRLSKSVSSFAFWNRPTQLYLFSSMNWDWLSVEVLQWWRLLFPVPWSERMRSDCGVFNLPATAATPTLRPPRVLGSINGHHAYMTQSSLISLNTLLHVWFPLVSSVCVRSNERTSISTAYIRFLCPLNQWPINFSLKGLGDEESMQFYSETLRSETSWEFGVDRICRIFEK